MEEGTLTDSQLTQLIETDINLQKSKGCHILIWYARVPESVRAELRQKGFYSIFKYKSTFGSKTIFTWEMKLNLCKRCKNDFYCAPPYKPGEYERIIRNYYGTFVERKEDECPKCCSRRR